MILTRREIEELIGEAEVMIAASIHNERIKTYLLNYNYDAARMEIGSAILEDAKAYYQSRIVNGGKQLVATSELEEAIGEAKIICNEHLIIGRLILKNEPLKMVSYSMEGERKKDIHGWIQQETAFYKSILNDPDMVTKYAGFGVTTEKLNKGLNAVNHVLEVKVQQEGAKSAAQMSTEVRDNAVLKLADWIHDLRTILKLALASEPQLLESAGILARSSNSPSHPKQSAKKAKQAEPPEQAEGQ
jgi:hypothetical protein